MDVRTVEELSLLESIEDFRRAYTVTPLDKERREMLRCLTHRIVEHDRMQRHNSEVIAKAKRVASRQYNSPFKPFGVDMFLYAIVRNPYAVVRLTGI